MNKPKKPTPSIKRNEGRHQPPSERIKNFEEVALGFNFEEALTEAARCLNCKTKPCELACPVNIKIPEFVELLYNEKITEAVSKIYETSLFPAICGRVCPQENYCEKACVLKDRFGSVSIGRLERFVADYARKNGIIKLPECEKDNGFKIACIGSGPASLAVAAELRKRGYDITIFEALHHFGGVLRYGIPSFRLPREIIDFEIENLKKMGVKFMKNVLIGKSISIEELMKDFDAIFIGTGAGLPTPLNLPGENLIGVYSSNEFLTRVNLMDAGKFPQSDTPYYLGKKVVVVGGGNTAMDAARCAKRLGPEEVTVIYRRTRNEMPARAEEIENAMEEGIKFEFLTAPVGLEGDEKGYLKRVKCIRMELGEPDESGRRRPREIKGSEFYIEADSIIVAIGQSPNPLIQQTTKELGTNKWNCLIVDENQKTTIEGIYAGGDVVRGGATVLLAMKDGKNAARAIDEYLKNKTPKQKITTSHYKPQDKYEILEKVDISSTISKHVIYAPFISKRAKPGQFVILRAWEKGERIPITLVDWDSEKGTITVIIQSVGKSTSQMNLMKKGNFFYDVAGPLGVPVEVNNDYKTVVVVGGGVGIAELYPIARAYKEAGKRVVSILGARTKDLLILEDEIRSISDKVVITTDDGSYGRKGVVTDALKDLYNEEKIDCIITIGPLPMMKFVALTTILYKTPTFASLNPIMLDGTGMCGGCRVEVGGEVKFACVDGPLFDAHKVNFDSLIKRNNAYTDKENESLEIFRKEHNCRIGLH